MTRCVDCRIHSKFGLFCIVQYCSSIIVVSARVWDTRSILQYCHDCGDGRFRSRIEVRRSVGSMRVRELYSTVQTCAVEIVLHQGCRLHCLFIRNVRRVGSDGQSELMRDESSECGSRRGIWLNSNGGFAQNHTPTIAQHM